jgi:WD40 repeat protein
VIWSRLGSKVGSIALPEGAFPKSIGWARQKELIAVACEDKKIRIFKGRDHKLLDIFEAQVEWPTGLEWSPTGEALAFADARGYIGIWRQK